MDLNFKQSSKLMFVVVFPALIYILAYALVISLIPMAIIRVLCFIITITPFSYGLLKIISKLSDKIDFM